jgi:hypothetical protein
VITEEAPGELSYFSPYFSYELAAYFAAGTFELGEVSVVAEEEVNGQDVLHLRVVGAPVATDIRPGGDDRDQVGAEIWITSSGLLVSFRHWIDSAEEGEGSEIEWTWDLYDLGAEFEIRPPLP